MRIGIDIDEVLVGTVNNILQYHNEVYKTNFRFEDVKDYSLWKLWGGTRDEAIRRVYGFYASPYFKELKPFPEAVEAINFLKEEHELFIITARQSYIKEETYKWLDTHFSDSFSAIYFAEHYGLKDSNNKRKSSICLDSKIELMLDDHPECALDCANCGINAFLFSKPWNKSVSHKRIIRVNSWIEVLKTIKLLPQNL